MKKTLFCFLFWILGITALFAQQDYYWVNGTGNWADLEHWATESGGTTKHTTLPTEKDNVYFDENSFTGASIVSISNETTAKCGNMNWEAIDQQVTFLLGVVGVFGNLTLSDQVTIRPSLLTPIAPNLYLANILLHANVGETRSLAFNGASIDTIANNDGGVILSFNGAGTFSLLDEPPAFNIMNVDGEANVELNGYNIELETLNLESGKLDMGSSEVRVSSKLSAYNSFEVNNTEGQFFIEGTLNNQTTSLALNWGAVTFSGKSTYQSLLSNTFFTTLSCLPGTSLEIASGTTFFFDDLVAEGTEEDSIFIHSSSDSQHVTFHMHEGYAEVRYVHLRNVHATGDAIIRPVNCTDGGGNEGWAFPDTSPPEFIFGTPEQKNILLDADRAEVAIRLNEPGRVYYVLLKNGSNQDPSITQITAGQNGAGEEAYRSGVLQIEEADIEHVITFTDITYIDEVLPGLYNFYCIAQDEHGNWQSESETIILRTLIPQRITFEDLPVKTFNDPNFTLSATGGSSDNPIVFTSSNTSVATIAGSTVTIVGAGTTLITASQEGNASYAPAAEVTQELVIEKAAQTITFTQVDLDFSASPVTLTGSSDSGLPVSYEIESGPASISGDLLTLTGTGTVAIVAKQPGSANYHAAEPKRVHFLITDESKTDQQINFTAIPTMVYGDEVTLTATADSGLPVSFELITGAGNLTNEQLTITGVGNYKVVATQSGNETFNPAPVVEQQFVVTKSELTVQADDIVIREGESIPTFTMSYTGFLLGDTVEDLDELPRISSLANDQSPAGEYALTITGGTDDHYYLTLAHGTLIIEDVLKTYSTDLVVVAYPNPTMDELNIKGLTVSKLQVYNPSGRLVMEANDTNTITLSGLPKGNYFLQAMDPSGKTYFFKLLKK